MLLKVQCLFYKLSQLIMNLKIDRVLPYPPPITQPYFFTFVPSLQSLILYPSAPLQEKPEQPKKKFNFKAPASSAATTEEVFIFELKQSTWRKQETKGKFPTRRENAGIACMGSCLMLFGGMQINPSKAVSDLYSLNINTWQWKKLFTMEAPPAHPSPIAIAIDDNKLLVVGKEMWVFSSKDVKWQLNKDDLPGGLWEKMDGDLYFQPKCCSFINNDLVIFGWKEGLKAISVNVEQKTMIKLAIEDENTQKVKGDYLQLCITSQGKGLLIDKTIFTSLQKQDDRIFVNNYKVCDEVVLEKFIGVQIQESNLRTNFAISVKKQLVSAQLTMITIPDQNQDDQLPNTSRQIQNQNINPQQSSIIERENFISQNSIPPPSPMASQQAISAPILSHLSPLLAREWLRRRILQQKGQLLQESIMKAEKMALALCRYGGEQQKRAHISKVRRIRQNLFTVFNRQSYFRKEMEERPGQNDLRQQALREQGGSSLIQFG